MSSAAIILLIVLISFVPVVLAIIWLRKQNQAIPLYLMLFCLASGIAALVLAVLFQELIPESMIEGRFSSLFDLFIRIAFTEESARLLGLMLLIKLSGFFLHKFEWTENMVAGAGLLSGLAFAALETAGHAVTESGIVLLRALSAAPLHGACGVRCGLAAFKLNKSPLDAGGRFLSAISLHTIYNFMLPRGGVFSALAVFLAISALITSARKVYI